MNAGFRIIPNAMGHPCKTAEQILFRSLLVKKKHTYVVRLLVSEETAQARLIDRSKAATAHDNPASFTVVVKFDAKSGTLSAWHSVITARVRNLTAMQQCSQLSMPALSSREAEVLQHLAQGEADKEIAKLLGISIGTVKVHVKTIIRKMRVTNRTQAAIVAVSDLLTEGGLMKAWEPERSARNRRGPSLTDNRQGDGTEIVRPSGVSRSREPSGLPPGRGPPGR